MGGVIPRTERIFFFTPSFAPAGGIIKIFDYACHAYNLGFDVVICTADEYNDRLAIFQIERFRKFMELTHVDVKKPWHAYVNQTDFAFFSLPSQYQQIQKCLGRNAAHEQIVHLIQGVRHANPSFEKGYAIRLLSRPMARIVINDIVLSAIQPYVNQSSMSEVIGLGHDTQFFHKERHEGPSTPMRVAYTTWKSDVGDRVASLAQEQNLDTKFRAIRGTATWTALRDLYQWADVYLATPGREEGFHLPGLEAMAAGAVVVTPDSGGNRTYCRFGKNCVLVESENPASYLCALEQILNMTDDSFLLYRQQAYQAAGRFSLEDERVKFGDFMRRLSRRTARMSTQK